MDKTSQIINITTINKTLYKCTIITPTKVYYNVIFQGYYKTLKHINLNNYDVKPKKSFYYSHHYDPNKKMNIIIKKKRDGYFLNKKKGIK